LRSQFDAEVQDHHDRLAVLMQQPDFLPERGDVFGNSADADNRNEPSGTP
jgi:hypothetical protein